MFQNFEAPTSTMFRGQSKFICVHAYIWNRAARNATEQDSGESWL
jgi:hypothetical protein